MLTADERRRRTLKYLQTCSKASREAFQLNRFSKAACLRKELRNIIEEYIEAEVEARLAARVREFAELGGCILPSRSNDPRQEEFVFNRGPIAVLDAGKNRTRDLAPLGHFLQRKAVRSAIRKKRLA